MEREKYSIDDILFEVKKRREEQENKLKQSNPEKDKEKINIKEQAKTEEKKPVQKKISEQNKGKEQNKPSKRNTQQPKAKKTPQKTQTPKGGEKKPQPQQKNTKPNAEKIQQEKAEPEKVQPEQKKQETVKKIPQPDSNGMINILEFADTPLEVLMPEPPQQKEKFFETKKGKIVKTVLITLVVIIALACVFGYFYVNKMLSNVVDNGEEEPYKAVEYYNGIDFLQEDFPIIDEMSAGKTNSYREYLKQWYKNGDPVKSSHVINILLIGEDTTEDEILDTSRADSAIIASINIDTGTIYLTSILRDLYVYYEIDGKGQYGKINSSAMGGMSNYIYTFERYYKISIDNYAVVNFASFPKIIDALGGVDINITTREINEINNNTYVYGDVGEVRIDKTFDGTEGVMRLDGLQALAYCRIRHIDSDNVRADRQKTVLNELFNKAKNAGKLDTVKLVNQLSQYTKTGFTKKELVSIGNTALRDGWLNFEIKTTNVPALENSKGGQTFRVSPNNWIWIADIPKDANELQTMVYGKSNIQLAENRPDYIAMGR